MRLLFEIIKKVKNDSKIVTYSLLMIDGILEDKRSRIEILTHIQKTHKKDKKENLVSVLNEFLISNKETSND